MREVFILALLLAFLSTNKAKADTREQIVKSDLFEVARNVANGNPVEPYDASYLETAIALFSMKNIALWCNYNATSMPLEEISIAAMNYSPGLNTGKNPSGNQGIIWGSQWTADTLIASLPFETSLQVCNDIKKNWRTIAHLEN